MAAPRRPRPLPPQARKRISSVRLSTDTTGSLPAYSSPTFTRPTSASEWPDNTAQAPHILDDQPPDYPQSAEEADQEDDFVPLRPLRSTATRRLRHRRSDSYTGSLPTSPSVDDLLERSVVALELSTNALMQSMNTQSSLSAIANDQILERSLDRQTRMLSMRIRGSRDAHEGWMDDLDEVMKGVDGLFGQEGDENAGVSRSLPTSSVMPRPRHRPSLNLPKSKSDSPYFHLSTSSELDLRDSLRPPRALTQYVSVESSLGEACEATADPESIFLPSTTGLRSAAQIRTFTGSVGSGPRPRRLRQSVSSPGPDLHNSAPSTPAYNMLSHLARKPSQSPPFTRTLTPPPVPAATSSSPTSETSRRTPRRHSGSSVDSNHTLTAGLRRSRSTSRGRSSASADTPPLPPVRAMTPPMEEVTPSSSSDSSSSPRKLNAFRTMQSLRKILDEAPPDPKGKRPAEVDRRSSRPNFQPRTPTVAASAGTSTATASVSRLLTRSSHHASHAPRQSSLKQSRSAPHTPSIPGTPNLSAPASRLSSTPSTPRQVSFAELPDSYSGRPRRRGKDKDKGKGKGKKGNDSEDGKWWSGWFAGGGSGIAAARHEERMEDRLLRGWGRPGVGGGSTDEWMM